MRNMSKNSKCPRKEDLCLNCCFAPFYLVAVCTSHSLPLLLFHFAGNLLFSELHVFRTCGYPFLLSCFCSSTEICIFVFIFILFFSSDTSSYLPFSLHTFSFSFHYSRHKKASPVFLLQYQ